ncbi:hypothetical protein D0T84_18050 [Dysgonomonas sp. 521]|uniref:DUF6913 domain-containing protein n=1 Tax=Dysgonomonas sp. 521 TaxID=2302932 RepID=UPI0013D75FD7|nr:hypothetical protein [Dysgonomonas sp. 521]NDV96795.1 hypothetical protein [Dysgonomonas sp. 521]
MFDFLVKWKIDSAFKKNRRNHTFRNLESMESILILFSYSDWKVIESIGRELSSYRKKVVMWTVQPSQKAEGDNTIFPANVRIIHPKEISMIQIVSSSVLKEFGALTYDTLIDLTTTENKVFDYLLARNSSECCIGISKTEYNAYDFVILREDDMDLPETFNQIKNYLNNVR